MNNKLGFQKTFISWNAVILVLFLGTVFLVGCGENSLPPKSPGNQGNVVITGGSV